MQGTNKKVRAPYNRTLTLSEDEIRNYNKKLLIPKSNLKLKDITNRIIKADLFDVIDLLPDKFIDLLFIDPPYNLHKKFNQTVFNKMEIEEYEKWMDNWISKIVRMLKPDASIYICGDWKSSTAIFNLINKYFVVRNRITWEREKGRGAKTNWKNNSEDIWFCTNGKDYKFNVEDVKMKRRVLAPYKENGTPKDWEKEGEKNFRITFPSNLWNDITIPFWSMPENTDHPTQKPEKLLAKIILASSNKNDFVFDPFLGAGTTAVVAKKLGRKYSGVEIDKTYCCLTEKRLEIVEKDDTIQGYKNGVFWERNTLTDQMKK